MTDIVERLMAQSQRARDFSLPWTAASLAEAANEIESLGRQLALQHEKLPRPIAQSRDNGPGIGDWRNLPEAP